MPFHIQPFFRKPFKLFAIDADTGQPLDPDVRKKTRVTYYELQNGSSGSKRLVAHKSASAVAKEAEAKPEEDALFAEMAKAMEGAIAAEQKAEDAAWTAEQDTLLKALKENNKTWAQIAQEMGRAKHQLQARWKEIKPADGDGQGKKEDSGKKDKGGGNGGQQGNEHKGGDGQGQGKQGKKNKGGGNNQNNNQNNGQKYNNNQKEGNKQNGQQNKKKDEKPAAQQNNQPAANANTSNEARFTMNDWLTLQEDDIFSFGELQCLSELIAKDMNQGWQRVAAKFFDLTGRRVHPDDVREKFESMAVAAEGKK